MCATHFNPEDERSKFLQMFLSTTMTTWPQNPEDHNLQYNVYRHIKDTNI